MGLSVYLSYRQCIAMWSLVLAIRCAILGRMWAQGVIQCYCIPSPDYSSLRKHNTKKTFSWGKRTAKPSIEIKAALSLVRNQRESHST